MTKTVDFLIVGQGLAGTILSHFLLMNECSIQVIDDHHKSSSSIVAAGLINPITGRNFVKSWMIDELLPIAIETYKTIESILGVHLVNQRNLIRTLDTAKEENEWLSRLAQEQFTSFVAEKVDLSQFEGKVEERYGYAEILNAYQIDLVGLLSHYATFLESKEALIKEKFDYENLMLFESHIEYKGINAKNIIFCEGNRVDQNPWFNSLPFQPAKGEALIITIKDGFDKSFKDKTNIIPLGNDRYWVGAGYEWSYHNDKPTECEHINLQDTLDGILNIPYEVEDHIAGIRPSTKFRRPFLGRHPTFNPLVIFNGMGAKGTSMIPYFAKHLVQHLLDGHELFEGVDIGKIK